MRSLSSIEIIILTFIASLLVYGVYFSYAYPVLFKEVYTVEDGFIEWATVVALLSAMVVCGRRFILLRKIKSKRFLAVTGLLTLLFLFGAGEEISWGQRLFDIETPTFFQKYNAQQDLGVHNLKLQFNGKSIKVNKLVFSKGFLLMMVIYLAVLTPLYRKRGKVKEFLDNMAVPMPQNYQIAGWLLIVLIVEGIIDSSKRGEMTEFSGSFMFLLILSFPYNREAFLGISNAGRE